MIGEHTGHAPCGCIPVERMRWFTGRFVTARDLTDEQRYVVHRRWLINRIMHGEGVLCGLERGPARTRRLRADHGLDRAGIALDCCGRELISLGRQCVTWPSASDPGCEPPEHEEKLLVIRYPEEPVDPQYALLDTCTTKVGKEADAHPRAESWWRLADREELPNCWPGDHRHGSTTTARRPGTPPRLHRAVLPVRRMGAARGAHPARGRPDPDLRPAVGPAAAAGYLTKICAINWPHGANSNWTSSSSAAAAWRSTSTGRCARRRATPAGSTSSRSGSSTAASNEPGVLALRRRPGPDRRDQGRLHHRSRPVEPEPPAGGPAGRLASCPARTVRDRHLAM